MSDDARFMVAALALGRRNLGLTAPNPSVGALIVSEGRVVGGAATAPGGRPHAETQALAEAGERARGATMYVTLEPCAHHGMTPPCADAIVAGGVSRVVCALQDPDVRTAGQGFARLVAGGVEVALGEGAEKARRDHLGHILRVSEGRPMVTLKMARTADGYAAGDEHDPRLNITGEIANRRTHTYRATHEAVMIGVGTVIGDDPLLTVRQAGLDQRPFRVVLDSRLRLPLGSRICATAKDYPTIVITGAGAPGARETQLGERGVEVLRVAEITEGRLDLREALGLLARRGLTRVFSEGGPTVGSALIRLGLADEVILMTAEKPLGRPGRAALEPDALAALGDTARYAEATGANYGPDAMRRWERRIAE
jgi:diaminohydroxyphosphoribosylaminopyrimidine deaminase / 5-amino-6-(5-phosphoribosylamino)uracil reductase